MKRYVVLFLVLLAVCLAPAASASGVDEHTITLLHMNGSEGSTSFTDDAYVAAHAWTAVGGVVRDKVYGNPIPNSTYHVKNGTEYTAQTNIAGYARVDNLVHNTLYDVWSTGNDGRYQNSTIVPILAVGR